MLDVSQFVELPTVKVETVIPERTITAVVVAFVLMISFAVLIIKLAK